MMMVGGRGGHGVLARQVGRLLGGGSAVALGEDRLLARFALDRDEAAFEALVARHGPMVLGTCRRMLTDPRDVEDAFQATFLVLARRAGSIRDPDRLGPWLHGVARRVAARARALATRRAAIERPGGEDRAVAPAPSLEADELRSALDEELARLPEKYRAPLVLCYLEGLTHDEAARHLRWPVGTVRSRLAGGRDRLRARLTRRGLAPTPAALPALLADPSLPPALLTATARLATLAGTVPAYVAALAQGALIAMTASKWKAIAAVALIAGLAAGGVGAIAQQAGQGTTVGKVEEPPKAADPIAALRKQLEAIETEMEGLNRRMEQVKHEQATELRPLEARLADLKAHAADLEKRWKDLVAWGEQAPATPGAVRAKEGGTGEPPIPDDLAKLQGEWKLVAVHPTPGGIPGGVIDVWLVVSGNNTARRVLGQKKRPGRLTLGKRDGAATIDMIEVRAEGAEQTYRGLYRLEGDNLAICRNGPDAERPADFKDGGSGKFPIIEVYRRPRVGGAGAGARPADDPLEAFGFAGPRIKQLEADNKLKDLTIAENEAWWKAEHHPVGPGPDGSRQGRSSLIQIPNQPDHVLLIPAEQDRITALNTATGERQT